MRQEGQRDSVSAVLVAVTVVVVERTGKTELESCQMFGTCSWRCRLAPASVPVVDEDEKAKMSQVRNTCLSSIPSACSSP